MLRQQSITEHFAEQFDQLTVSPQSVNMTLLTDVINFDEVSFRIPTVRFLRLYNHDDVLPRRNLLTEVSVAL
jgi:hypothetical protein